MMRYHMTAAALRFFSASPQTRRAYRAMGNTVGQRRRIHAGLGRMYLNRARRIVDVCQRHQAIKSGDRLLEIGTGWIHWESTVIRLFYDVDITLFDVWDNRQFGAYKRYCRQLGDIIDHELYLDAQESDRAHALLSTIAKATSFDEIYNALGFHYVIDPSGTLAKFADDSFSVVFSCNVLEHVEHSSVPTLIHDMGRVLQPDGHSIHEIDLGDHLAYYDQTAHPKNYLRYSDSVWRRYYENSVQYINRTQRPEWLRLFDQAGLAAVEEQSVPTDIGAIAVDRSFQGLSPEDLQCLTLRVVHRKPRELGNHG